VKEALIDHRALLAGVDGDRQLLRELASLFLADYPRNLVQMKNALRLEDADALAKEAHKLKGAIGNFAAKSVTAAAELVDRLAREGDLPAASDALTILESELTMLGDELKRLSDLP
jgi:HPt (histidine-containing phosphotransfer) domain-containing protein